MRIAIFQNLPSGGAKRAVYEWTSRLAEKNEIDVYTLSTADHVFCDIRQFSRRYNIAEFYTRKLYTSPFGRLNQIQRWHDLNDLERLNRNIADQINSSGYDVLFANPDVFTLIPSLLSHVTIPSVYYLHEPFGPGFVRHVGETSAFVGSWREKLNRYDPLIRLYQNRMEKMRRRSIQRTSLLLANSEFTRGYIQKGYGVDVHVCYCGVDLMGFHRMPEVARERFVLSVGELSPRKGFAFIIKSLGYIPSERRPSLKLACNLVDQYERKYIESLALQHGVDLEIFQNLNTDQLRLLYNRAGLCVYAPIMEPFGLVPLEAMACGTAVIGVREGGVMESVIHESTGLLIERDEKKFGVSIMHLLENPSLVAEYGRNGLRYILENWTWEKSTAELEQYLFKAVRQLAHESA